jgi:hypothetical protein
VNLRTSAWWFRGGLALLTFSLGTGAGAQETEEEEEAPSRPAALAATLGDGDDEDSGDDAEEETGEEAVEEVEEDDPPDHDAGSSSSDGQRTAESPALVVMGNSDLEIARPRTPSALAATLLSSFTDGGYLPDGFAVEVTPFWLFPHPNLTLERYAWGVAGKARMQVQDRKRAKLLAEAGRPAEPAADAALAGPTDGPALSPFHNLAVSVALSSEDATNQSLGFGLRLPLREGNLGDSREDVRACLDDLAELQRYRSERLGEWLWDHVSELEVELASDAPPVLQEAVQEAQRALVWSLATEPDEGEAPGPVAREIAAALDAMETYDTREERRDKADFWLLAFAREWLAREGEPPQDAVLRELTDAVGSAVLALLDDAEDGFAEAYQAHTGRAYADDRAAWQDDCEDTIEVRRGFALDLAGGLSLGFEDWKIGRAQADTYGVWLTPAYLADEWSLVGMVGQFGRQLDSADSQYSIDLGVRGIYGWRRLAISPEVMGRFVVFDPDPSVQLRWALGVDLMVFEGVWISASIGMDDELPYDKDVPLLSMLKLEFDTGTDRVLAPDTSELGWLTPVEE